MSESSVAASTSYTYAYVRVSSIKQSFDRQIADIDAYRDEQGAPIPEKRRFAEKITGATMERAQLRALLDQARPGDTIVVSSLDRFGRTAMQTLQTLELLDGEGIFVKSLKAGENFEGHTGKLIRGIMALVAEWERVNTAERAADARAARAAKGEERPRAKSALKPDAIALVRKHAAAGMAKVDIVKATGLSRSSVYRALTDA